MIQHKKNTFQPIQYICRRYVYNSKFQLFQISIPLSIIFNFTIMIVAVDLNHNKAINTKKINYIIANDFLPVKIISAKFPFVKLLPK